MSTMNTVGRPTAPNAASDASYKPATLTGGRGLLQDEPLIFEGEGWGKTGVDLPKPATNGSDLGDTPPRTARIWAIWSARIRSACPASASPRPCGTMCA